MYILSLNVWFQKLIRQFFFAVDRIVFGFIADVYDLLITIARTSPLSQADILDMAGRIYKLLAVFMIFKVTFSLIMYVVNPDDFSDKNKGLSKLVTNIIISLCMLILTPYIFNYAYQLQTIILEDNSLGTLIFGDNGNTQFLNSAGDDMAYLTLSPFITPNTSIKEIEECIQLTAGVDETKGIVNINDECFGMDNDFNSTDDGTSLFYLIDNGAENFSKVTLENYAAGIQHSNFGLTFRQDLMLARYNDSFIIDYKFIFSTVMGVIILLLLLTFCLDVALRSVKLAFLQLIAPIPILSYVDPKSGKDGMFKKWYQMCFKTYLSLFIRLLALYFAVYIISLVADMRLVDVVDGTHQTNTLIAILIIIGALMFAKQFPKILEGLGLKLDGDGKFTLNPFRKIENEAIGGKILKKPNDMMAKIGKGIVMSPINGASLLGKKTIGGIDAARHGKGFKQGWNRTHGKLHNNFYKKLDEWAPDSAEARKNERLGRENLHHMDRKAKEGERVYASARGNDKNLPFSPEYRRSYDKMNFAKGEMYKANAEKQAKIANVEEQLRRGLITQDQAQRQFEIINKDAGTAEKRYEVAKARHDEIRKIYAKDAELEDSFDYFDKTATPEQKAQYKSDVIPVIPEMSESEVENDVSVESPEPEIAPPSSPSVMERIEEVTGVSASPATDNGATTSALIENINQEIINEIKKYKEIHDNTTSGVEMIEASKKIKELEQELEAIRRKNS